MGALPVWRKVYLWAYDTAASAWTFLTTDASQNLNVNVAASSKVIAVTDITSDSFSAGGAGFTFGTVWADVEIYDGYAVWVQNATGTNPITAVQFEVADGLAGAGLGGLALFGAVPAAINPATFLVAPFLAGYAFNGPGLVQQGKAYRSFRLGVQLNAATPVQTVNLFYRGFTL